MIQVFSNAMRSQIKDEASVWVVKLDRELTGVEVEALQSWLQQSELHRDTLFELAGLWDDLCVLNQLSSLFPFNPANLSSEREQYRLRFIGIAASLLFCLIAASWYFEKSSLDVAGLQVSIPNQKSVPTSFSTQVGENRVVTLVDGSSVHLNTNSLIKTSFTPEIRSIELVYGEARFSVARDHERPFIVHAGDSSVRALGTVFNVHMRKDAVEVLVTEGKVLVTGAKLPVAEQVTVLPGQWTSVDKKGIQAAKSLPFEEVQEELAWRDGMLIFRGETLADAVVEIGRYTKTPIRLADKEAGALKIAGFFKAGDVDGLLSSLTENFPVSYSRRDGAIVIASADTKMVTTPVSTPVTTGTSSTRVTPE